MMRYISIALIGLLMSSCDKNELQKYEEGSGIYFDNQSIMMDTIGVSWGLKNTDVIEQKIKMEVHLFGKVVDYDRPFNITIKQTAGDTTQAKVNEHYRTFPTSYIIPAGKSKAVIEIDLLRSESLKYGSKTLTIGLEESDELRFLYSRKVTDSTNVTRLLDAQRVLKMNENFPIPRWWYIHGTRYFGNWSMKKSILICDLMDISRERWVGDVLSDEDFNEGILKYAGVYVHRWLATQNPVILDEDGKPMEMGRDSKR